MFIALAQHNTGHGLVASIICATDDSPRDVLVAARNAEQLGYEFFENESGVLVVMIGNGERLTKEQYKYSTDRPPADYPIVYSRTKRDGKWIEEWLDSDLERDYAEDPLELDSV